jgi:Zn-finger nucleic acid-binding protein
MNCPRCHSSPLNVAQRQGVEIDTCPHCRGVWLDRGELDKIINRYEAFDHEEERDNYDVYLREHAKCHDHPRRRSFWQELFD